MFALLISTVLAQAEVSPPVAPPPIVCMTCGSSKGWTTAIDSLPTLPPLFFKDEGAFCRTLVVWAWASNVSSWSRIKPTGSVTVTATNGKLECAPDGSWTYSPAKP